MRPVVHNLKIHSGPGTCIELSSYIVTARNSSLPQSSAQPSDERVVVRLRPNVMAALDKIATDLGVSSAEALGRALGLDLYLLEYADGSNYIYIENEAGTRTRMVLRHGR